MMVKCGICGEIVKKRLNALYRAPNADHKRGHGILPVDHVNPATGEKCHGFFREARLVDV